MKVILDIHRNSCIHGFTQYCNSVEGFLDIKNSHPEDDFIVEIDSAEAYQDYMEKKVMAEIQFFCDNMCWTLEDYSAAVEWQSVSTLKILEEQELDELHDMWMQEELDWYIWARQNGYE